MGVSVVCVGGPHDGRSYSGIEADDTGYLLFQGTLGEPNAWYRIAHDADAVPSSNGPAQPAIYVGERKDG